MVAKTNQALLDNAVALYAAGKSALEVKSLTGVDRGVLKTELLRRGIEPRGRSSAGKLRASKMTVEERLSQAAAAHVAATGRKHTFEERAKRARTVERQPPAMSVHEQTFADHLNELGVPFRREAAVGIYNLDFAIGSVGVEILGGEWHAYKGERHPRRIKYILGQNWSLVYVWATQGFPLTLTAAKYCVAYAQQVSREPSLIGEYRVIRGDAQLVASGRDQLDEFSLEQASRYGINIPPSERRFMGARVKARRNR